MVTHGDGVVVLTLLRAPVSLAQHRDHPLISRYAGSTEVVKDYVLREFDEYPLVVGPYQKKAFTNSNCQGPMRYVAAKLRRQSGDVYVASRSSVRGSTASAPARI